MNLDEVLARILEMDDTTKQSLKEKFLSATANVKWMPNAGPQSDAYECQADILLYGGQAGGGKSALLTGLALTQHRRSLLMRRQYTDLGALIDDTLKQNGTRDGFNGAPPARLRTGDGRVIEFGAAKMPGDEEHWKGQPHDFLGIDEASQFLESQFKFLSGWVRSVEEDQRTRIVLATNPPEKPGEGRWLFEMFAPWLDPGHPNPAKPGELRWYATDAEGRDMEVDGPEPVEFGKRTVRPMSRTFIPAALVDNPFLKDTGYEAALDNLPEPLRSAVRDGNWMISHKDDLWQLIPTNWVMAAQDRWVEKPPIHVPMCAIGVDVAQGGSDNTVLACRYDGYFSELVVVPGIKTPLGSDVAALVLKYRRDGAMPVIDMGGGYGGAALEHLKMNNIDARGFKGAAGSGARTKDRQLGFFNKRSEVWWKFREALDPDQPGGSPIMLPRDQALMSDLVSLRYEMTPRGIKAETKEDVIKRLGRSPDRGDAVVMAWSQGDRTPAHGQVWRHAIRGVLFPKVIRGHEPKRRRA